MIRLSLLTIFVTFICVYSFKDWYRALCLLLPLLAVLERPDMPRTMLEIPGLNPYNLALVFVMFAFLLDRRKAVAPAFPKWLVFLLSSYLVVFIIAFSRFFLDLGGLYQLLDYMNESYPGTGKLVIEHVIDPIRFVIPGVLLSRGIDSRDRLNWALYAILTMGALLSLQIIWRMGPALWGDDTLADRALRVLDRDLGYHRVASATILSMIVPAFLALFTCSRNVLERQFATGGLVICSLALALTGGRAGLLAGGVACAILAFYRSKKLLVALSIIVAFTIPAVPGLQERLVEGFEAVENRRETREQLGLVDAEGRDFYVITSGRAAVWPVVMEKIGEAPVVGYGKEAMQREGITLGLTEILEGGGMGFGHPHNAYLELFLDNGILGALPILLLFLFSAISAKRSFLQSKDLDLALVAGALLGFLIGFAVSSIGSGSFYPQLRTTTLWCLLGVYFGAKYSSSLSIEVKPQETISESDRPMGLWTKVSGGHAHF